MLLPGALLPGGNESNMLHGGYEFQYHEGIESRVCLMQKALIAAYYFTCSVKELIPTFILLIR